MDTHKLLLTERGMKRMEDCDHREGVRCGRRAVLGVGLAAAPWLAASARADDPTSLRPQPGDNLVYLVGPKQGKPIRSDDLQIGAIQVQAYPAAPNGTVRDGSRLNLVIVARIGYDGVSEDTRAHMADGVVAYSGVCTHQGCPVNMWSDERHAFVCSCHGSIYDPRNDATVLFGPAPRHLAALPLKSENGVLKVAGGFIGRVGVQSS
jgi:rieske iron-sulfur protein